MANVVMALVLLVEIAAVPVLVCIPIVQERKRTLEGPLHRKCPNCTPGPEWKTSEQS